MALTDLPDEPQAQKSSSSLQRILPFTTVALIVAVLYVSWIFYSRYETNKEALRAIEARKEEHNKQVVSQVFGSGEIRFSMFSADTGLLKRGSKTELCYGVVNAKTVKLDPPVAEITPSYRHCLEISPKTTTTYTITADDGKGHTKSQSLTIHVQ